jgi:nicotinamide-nucleotide amidase
MVAVRLTDPPGCSDYFNGGYVTYTEQEKNECLGVPWDLLNKYTAVSEPVAAAMAEGVRKRNHATHGLSVTGFAGPTGGNDFDPVGTVYIGVAAPGGTHVIRVRHGGDRFRVRALATQNALDFLRKTLMK